jgi:hypothetical protein
LEAEWLLEAALGRLVAALAALFAALGLFARVVAARLIRLDAGILRCLRSLHHGLLVLG